MRIRSQEAIATFKIALSAILYGCLGFLGIKLLKQMPTATMLFWRFFIASMWSAPSLFKQFPQIKQLKLSTFLYIILFVSVFYGCGSFAYFLACQSIGTGLAMVVFFAYPLFVILFSWILEKRAISSAMLLAVLGIIVGMVMLEGFHGDIMKLGGIGFALLSGFSYAVYVYVSQHNTKVIPSGLLTLLVCFGSALVFLVYCLFSHTLVLPNSLLNWCYAICIGVIATALPIQLMLEGLKFVHSSKASILTVLEPLTTVFIGVIALNESLSIIQTIGVIIVLVSALAIQFVN